MDWEDVKTFAAVAAAGSVRRAAALLGVHHSTVSRRIERLEASLNVRLFDRRPEGYEITEVGEELLPLARRFGDELYDAERRLSGRDGTLTGKVTVTMAEPIAVHGFAPRLKQFAERYPELELEIRITMNLLDIARGDADIAVRMDNNPPDTLVGKRLFPYCETIYASPEYIAEHDIARAPHAARWIGWCVEPPGRPAWVEETPFRAVPSWGGFPNLSMQMAAARQGLGFAALPCYLADGDPGLKRAIDMTPVPAREIWVLTHPDLRKVSRIRAVMRFAEEILRDDRAKLQGVA